MFCLSCRDLCTKREHPLGEPKSSQRDPKHSRLAPSPQVEQQQQQHSIPPPLGAWDVSRHCLRLSSIASPLRSILHSFQFEIVAPVHKSVRKAVCWCRVVFFCDLCMRQWVVNPLARLPGTVRIKENRDQTNCLGDISERRRRLSGLPRGDLHQHAN